MEEKSDVLIVGAGFAGFIAAVESANTGVKVMVLEKGDSSFIQTSTYHSGGGFDIFVKPYGLFTPDELYDRFIKTSDYSCDNKLVRILCDNQKQDYEWIRNLIPFVNNRVKGGGRAILPYLKSIAEEKGIKINFLHKAMRLLTNDMGGIIGVKVMTPTGIRDFNARAVVLATGGFEWNAEMMLKYFGPQLFNGLYKHGATGKSHTGDGALMAMEVGASLMRSSCCIHSRIEDKTNIPGKYTTGGPIRRLKNISELGILVNKWGKRFIDETKDSDTKGCAIAMQPDGEAILIFDENIRKEYPQEFKNYERLAKNFGVTDIIMKFDTLKELSNKIDIIHEDLKSTISEFNSIIKDGRALDLEIPKARFDPVLEQGRPPESRAYKIENPPFYAVYPVWSGNNTIWGGLDITENSEVKDRDEKPIPGLFACGGLHGGIMFGKWYQTPSGIWTYYGNYHYLADSFPTCLVFGRIAGKNAAIFARNH